MNTLVKPLVSKTLSISNIPTSVSSADLEDMFTMIGNVASARVLCDPTSGASEGRGFVEMATREEAENGRLHFNGKVMEGRALMVRINDPLIAKNKETGEGRGHMKLRRQVRRIVKDAK